MSITTRTTRATSYKVETDLLDSEVGMPIVEGALHTYNNELKAHLNGSIVTVYPQSSGGSDYTETIVNISSAEIFNSTTTAIELLPALTDDNKYYDIQKIIFEYQGGDTEFSYDGSYWNIQIRDNDILFLLKPEILTTTDKKYAIYTPSLNRNADSGSIFVLSDFSIGSSLYITSTTDDVITQGNGTLRVKIYHKAITFGA